MIYLADFLGYIIIGYILAYLIGYIINAIFSLFNNLH